jgi:hypothetical protein
MILNSLAGHLGRIRRPDTSGPGPLGERRGCCEQCAEQGPGGTGRKDAVCRRMLENMVVVFKGIVFGDKR